MVTVSAVVFLYSPAPKLASVVINMDDAGDTAAAAAMSVLVILFCLSHAVRLWRRNHRR
jgi:iron(III) transport system permease protein